MTTMTDIESATKAFADARSVLVERVTAMRDEREAVKRRHLKPLKRAVENTAAAQHVLTNHIDNGRELFTKPRSVVFHGIKVGLQKGKASLVLPKNEVLAQAIRDHLPEQYGLLVETICKPVQSAIAQLDAAALKAIGVKCVPASDSVLIKPTDGDVDKTVNAFLKDAMADADEADEVDE